jgi:hypothetical protein
LAEICLAGGNVLYKDKMRRIFQAASMNAFRPFFLLLAAGLAFLALSGCARTGAHAKGLEDELVVEKITEGETARVIEIPIPPNPYEDEAAACAAACCCPNVCQKNEKVSELESFIGKLKAEATVRAEAAAAALLKAGPDLARYEDWKQIVRDSMDLLGSPTLVVVQLPSGKWKKVKFEKVPEMDISEAEVVMIQKSVGEKMQSAIAADMTARGVPAKEAGRIAEAIIKTYLEKIFGSSK